MRNVLAFLHAASRRVAKVELRAIGDGVDGNLIARVYDFWQACEREWTRCSQEAKRGKAREQIEFLMLDVNRLAIIDRHEPRVRRDLSRTIRELHDLQDRRLTLSLDQSVLPLSARSRFSQNEPIEIFNATAQTGTPKS